MFAAANSDATIIRQVLNGHPDRFSILVKRYHPVLFGVAYAQIGNRADAEDIVQEAFLKSYENLHSLRETAKFGAWLVRIARNACNDFLDKRRRETTLPAQEDLPGAPPDVIRAEAHEILWKNIFKLESEDREILLLYYFAAKNTSQIAELAGISPEAAKKRLQRARAGLGQELEQSLGAQIRAPHPDQSLKRIMAILPPGLYAANASAAATGATVFLTAGAWGKVMTLGVLLLVVSAAAWWNPGSVRGSGLAAVRNDDTTQSSRPSPIASSGTSDQTFRLAALPAAPPPQTVTSAVQVLASLKGVTIPEGTVQYNLSGQVTDSQGQPVAGAEVRLSTRGVKPVELLTTPLQERATQTAKDGTFFFDALKTGREDRGIYVVSARKDGMAGFQTYAVYGTRADSNEDTIALSPAESISGTVHDLAGNPLAGAMVYPFKHTSHKNQNPYMAIGTVQTDKEGRFRLDDLLPGEWEVLAWAPGYSEAKAAEVNTDSDDLNLILLPARCALKGRAVDSESGAPLSEISLLVSKESEKSYPWVARAVQTDASGAYTLDGLTAGEYTIQPLPQEGNPYLLAGEAVSVVLAADDNVSAPDLPLSRGAEISGRVFDPGTKLGLSGVYVRADATDRRNNVASLPSDADGNYRITGLAPGAYTLYAIGTGGSPALSLAAGQKLEGQDITYKYAGVLRGSVSDAQGVPVVGATITASGGSEVFGAPVRSGSDGGFLIRGIAFDDRITLQARWNNLASLPSEPVKVGRTLPEPVVLTLSEQSNASIAGKALDSRGNALSEASITYWSPALVYGTSTLSVKTDNRGDFKISGLPAGTYQLQALPKGLMSYTKMSQAEVIVAKDKDVKGVELRLPGSDDDTGGVQSELTITRRVTDTDGAALPGVLVQARGDSNDTAAATDAAGRYILSHLAEGEYFLLIEQQGYNEDRKRSVRAGSNGVDFVLQANATVCGRVVDAVTGKPLPGARVVQFRGNYIPTDPMMAFRNNEGLRTGTEGEFRMANVRSGTVALLVSADFYAPAILTFNDLREREVRENIVIKLSAGGRVEFLVKNASGEPVAAADIHAGNPGMYGPMTNRPGMSRTDQQGAALVSCLPVGRHWFTVTAENHAPARVGVDIDNAQDNEQVEVIMPAGGTIRGIASRNGKPTGEGSIWLNYVGQDDLPRGGARLDANGAFEITNVLPGLVEVGYSFVGDGSNEYSVTRLMEINDAAPIECPLDFLSGEAAAEGRVFKNDEPIKEGVTLEFERNGTKVKFETWANADGIYRFNEVPDGPAVLKAGTWFLDDTSHDVELEAGQTLQQDLQISSGSQELQPEILNEPNHWNVKLLILKGPPQIGTLDPAALDAMQEVAVRTVTKQEPTVHSDFSWPDLQPGTYHVLGIAAPQWTTEGLAQAITTTTPVEIAEGAAPQTVTLNF